MEPGNSLCILHIKYVLRFNWGNREMRQSMTIKKVEAILDGEFYTTYKEAKREFSEDTFTCAENTIDQLLNTATTSEHPGMLLGKVQS